MIRHHSAVGRAQGTGTRRRARRALGLVAAATTAVAVLPLAAPGTTALATPSAAARVPLATTQLATTPLASATSTASVDGPAPSITGRLVVGSVLTATPGTWSPAPVTLSYQWYRAGTAITGATARTYTLQEADRASTITVVVVGRKSGHTARGHVSTATGKVLGRLITYPPRITSELVVGKPYSISMGTWGPGLVRRTTTWNRSGVPLPLGTQNYTPTAADIGHLMTWTVVGRKDGYAAQSRTSNAVRVFGQFTAGQPSIDTPYIDGKQVLAAEVGTWAPAPATMTYQWYRALPTPTAIPGATSPTYTLTEADRDNYLQVRVTGTRPYYLTMTQRSEWF